MTQYDEQLRELKQKIARAKNYEYLLPKLYEKRNALSQKVYELEKCKLSEQEDVERLERLTVSSLFYRITGQMDEKLNKEKEESSIASANYAAAVRELEAVRDEIWSAQCEVRDCENYEKKYREILQAKIDKIKTLDIPETTQLIEFEQKITSRENAQKELKEAIAAGNHALTIAKGMNESLESAKKLGTYDMLGGGVLADVAKHKHIDSAQIDNEKLQVALRRFKSELVDITVQAPEEIGVDGFLKTADYWFDGWIFDRKVLEQIKQSQSQIEKTISDILRVLSRLNYMEKDIEQELDRLLDMRNDLIQGISM